MQAIIESRRTSEICDYPVCTVTQPASHLASCRPQQPPPRTTTSIPNNHHPPSFHQRPRSSPSQIPTPPLSAPHCRNRHHVPAHVTSVTTRLYNRAIRRHRTSNHRRVHSDVTISLARWATENATTLEKPVDYYLLRDRFVSGWWNLRCGEISRIRAGMRV